MPFTHLTNYVAMIQQNIPAVIKTFTTRVLALTRIEAQKISLGRLSTLSLSPHESISLHEVSIAHRHLALSRRS